MVPTNSAGMSVPGHEFLYQLQQLQHQQMHQQGMAAAYGYSNGGIQPMAPGFPSQYAMAPPMISRAPSMANMMDDNAARHFGSIHSGLSAQQQPSQAHTSGGSFDMSAASNSGEDGASLIQRLEKKDHMISQLGSFLSQMKQESEGTANAWKEKLQEISDLKRQLAAVTQQLTSAQGQERETASQLEQVGQELAAAMHALKESEQTHIEELTIMNEEIKKRQSEADHMKVGYEQSLKDISQELLDNQQKQQEAISRCQSLEEALQKVEKGNLIAFTECDDERRNLKKDLEDLASHLEGIEREKQELGQHLWNVTQELQHCKQHEEELERKCEGVVSELEKSQSSWSERFHHFQSEKAEQLGVHSMLQSQLQEMEAQFQNERAQKEELNELMVREIQRFHDEMEHLHQSHKESLEHELSEKEQWKLQALDHEEKLARLEKKLAQACADVEELQGRLRQIDEENQHLQQNGTEKASTLQEMNNKLRKLMDELHDTQIHYEQLQAHWERHQNGLRKCVQLLSAGSTTSGVSSQDLDLGDSFPERIISALEEYVQLSSSIDEMKISVLRAQQDLDSDRERFRQREQELLQQCQSLQGDLEGTRADAKILAQELQQLSRQFGGNETKLSAQVQQLTKELDDVRTNSGLQVLQLQKSLDSQRVRTSQLENEKKDLLQEAEHLNSSMDALYQTRNEKQIELDQLRATWKELQLEHSDLRENYEDLDARTARTIDELNAKLEELQGQIQTHRSQSNALKSENEQMMEQLDKIQAEYKSLSHRFIGDQAKWLEKEQELGTVLEDKTHRMDEMMEMLTQLQSKTEFLEKSRLNEDQSARQEIEKYQQQLLGLGQEKKRFELAYTSLKAQHDQVLQETFALKEEKRHFVQQQNDTDEEFGALKTEHTRLKSEFDRVNRTKSGLQAELHRVTDEAQDVLRQFEVVRRDARAQEKNYQGELERMRKEIEDLRAEGGESSALVEEMQTKMTSIQNAANATINDLMTELQNAQETISFEKNRLHKENEMLKSQLKSIDEDMRRKEMDLKELQAGLRLEKDQFSDKENEMMLKFSRLTNTLEQKKQEVDKLSKELETKGLKVAEYERKLTPLANAKDSLQAKNTELKQAFDAKTREAHDMEERFRDDMARLMKEKRDLEALYVTMKEDYEAMRSQTSGHQQQWQNDCKVLKHNLERTKNEVIKANTEVLTLTQRLESCQGAANETISELSSRLQAAEQQKEMSVNGLQREINLERERRREAEVQKMELQRLLRQKGGTPIPAASSVGISSIPMEDRSVWSSGAGGSDPEISTSMPPRSVQNASNNAALAMPLVPTQSSTPKAKPAVAAAPALEIRKFYANEPMTNAELSNLPMALIKAQIGLDLSSEGMRSHAGSSSPTKGSHFRASSSLALPDRELHHHQENNDDIPPLPLEKLPQYVQLQCIGYDVDVALAMADQC